MKTQVNLKKVSKAIKNDVYRQKLFHELFELYSQAEPIVTITKDNNIVIFYKTSLEKSATKIRNKITQRDTQIYQTFL